MHAHFLRELRRTGAPRTGELLNHLGLERLGIVHRRYPHRPPSENYSGQGPSPSLPAVRYALRREAQTQIPLPLHATTILTQGALLGNAPEAVFRGGPFFLPTSLYAAWAHQMRGDDAATYAAFESARAQLDSALAALPEDRWIHASRGLAMAGLGQREEALQEVRWLRQLFDHREDHLDGARVGVERALILAQAGEIDAALDEIEELLAVPSFLSIHRLRIDPRWDPLRSHPRFQAFLER